MRRSLKVNWAFSNSVYYYSEASCMSCCWTLYWCYLKLEPAVQVKGLTSQDVPYFRYQLSRYLQTTYISSQVTKSLLDPWSLFMYDHSLIWLMQLTKALYLKLKLNLGNSFRRDVFGKIWDKERAHNFHVHGSRVSVGLLCLIGQVVKDRISCIPGWHL